MRHEGDAGGANHHEILDAERNDRTVPGIECAPLRVYRVRLSVVFGPGQPSPPRSDEPGPFDG